MMKKNIGIVLLIIVLINQCYFIYKKSYSGYILNPKYQTEKVNIDYVVLSYNLSFIKEMIPNNKKTVMSVFFSEESRNKYDICLQYFFNKRNFYPIDLPSDHRCMPLSNYTEEKFIDSISKNENDYVVFVGKELSMLNVTTKKDISLYKVIENKKLELIAEYDNNLYNLREKSEKYNRDYYQKALNYIEKYMDNYSYFYGYSSYSYLYEFANELIQNNEKKLALEYYNKYLELPLITSEIVVNKAKIYAYLGQKDNLKLMVDYCNTLNDCDKDVINNIKLDLEVQ